MQDNEAPKKSKRNLIEVLISDDGIVAYVRLTKPLEDEDPITKENILQALASSNVVYGIKEDVIEKLAARPIYGIKIEVVLALAPIDGENGQVIYRVQRDADYKPEINEEGNIDYKNLNYFQIVKKDQVLCDIIKEKEGIPGKNVYGAVLHAKIGKRPPRTLGKNTYYSEDETALLAGTDGMVHFIKDQIDISETMNIRSNINNATGNINFPGDVFIDGDICEGFSVKCGGDLVVKGVVEAAKVEAAGNIHIAKGINGGSRAELVAGRDFRSQYIEAATLRVGGNICADYISGSDITCGGNIDLKGQRELVIGGDVKLCGDLTAKDIGNERELPTRVEILSVKIDNSEAIARLKEERDAFASQLAMLRQAKEKYDAIIEAGGSVPADSFEMLKNQIGAIVERTDLLVAKIRKEENSPGIAYLGSITCKRKLYQGVSVHIADQKLRFTFDNIEHCRIYWNKGEIVQSTL